MGFGIRYVFLLVGWKRDFVKLYNYKKDFICLFVKWDNFIIYVVGGNECTIF